MKQNKFTKKREWVVVISMFLLVIFTRLSFGEGLMKKQARNYLREGISAQKTGDLDLAISSYTKAISVDPDFAQAYNNLGTACAQKGDHFKAEKHYHRAVSIDPHYTTALKNLAIIYAERKDYERFYEYWKRATGIDVYSPFLIDDDVEED